MFTVKYRAWERADAQPPADATNGPVYSILERLDGPFSEIATRYEDGYLVVSCRRDGGEPGMCYGPVIQPEDDPRMPRPILWVMNEQGATIAKYDL